MDFGKAFSFVFEDERWLNKVLIGGLITMVPIVNFATLGYMIKVAQNVAQGNPRPLPEWNEFGEHFSRGLNDVILRIVYALPVIIPVALLYCVSIGLAISASSAGSDSAASGAGALVGGLFFCIIPIAFIVGLVLALLTGAAQARYAATNSLSEGLRFRDVIATVRSNPQPWLMLLLMAIVANFVGGLGSIALFVGVFFTAFYSQCVFGHALGQTMAQQGGVPIQQPQAPTYTPPPTFQ